MTGFSQTWIVSFGAKWISGEGWEPSYLVACELSSRQSVGLDRAELFATPFPPYRTGNAALFVCFVGEAMVGCHIKLGWPPPTRVIDLRAEFRNLSNGHRKPCGDGVIGALIWCTLPISGVVFTPTSTRDGMAEVAALEQLYLTIFPRLTLPRAILRGRYLVAAARIEATGVPVDVTKLEVLKHHWRNIIRQTGTVIVNAKPKALAIGVDHRHRCEMRPFSSRTGRNQPRSAEFLLASPGWLRRLIKPEVGTGLALVDWQQQEYGVAAALSVDERMMADYQCGDPYLALAERYGHNYAPSGRGGLRKAFKACALGVLNGIGQSGLARQIGCSPTEARLLLQEHRAEYPQFWRWSDGVEMEAHLYGRLQSVFGWGVAVNALPIRASCAIIRCSQMAPKCSAWRAVWQPRTAFRSARRTMTHC